MHILFSKKKKRKSVDNFDIAHKTCQFKLGVYTPLDKTIRNIGFELHNRDFAIFVFERT